MKTVSSLTLSLLVPLLAFGCFDADDLGAPDERDGSSSEPVSDASAADADLTDAGPDELAPSACTASSDCRDGEVCAPDGYCLARCDDAGACVVLSSKRQVTALLADGPVLYVGLGPTYDRLGNAVGDAELRTLVGDGAPALLTTEADAPMMLDVRGEYLYWRVLHTAGGSLAWTLRRVPKLGGSASVGIYESARAESYLLGPDGEVALRIAGGIYLGSADGKAELRKVVDESECPSRQSSAQCGPFGLTSEAVYYRRRGDAEGTDMLSSVDLRTMERKDHGSGWFYGDHIEIAPPHVYFVGGSYPPNALYRRDLRDLTRPDFVVYRDESTSFFAFQGYRPMQRHGDWIYTLTTNADRSHPQFHLTRAAALGPVAAQPLVRDTFAMRTPVQADWFTVSGTHVFLAVRQLANDQVAGSLVYRIPLPAAP